MAIHRSKSTAALTGLTIAAVIFAASAFLANTRSSSSLFIPTAENERISPSDASSSTVAR